MTAIENILESANLDSMKELNQHNYKKVLAEIIEEYLRDHDINRPQLAEKIGITERYLRDITLERANPSTEVLTSIFDVVGAKCLLIRKWK